MTLIVSYETRPLRECCCSLAEAERVFGSAIAQDLIALIAEAEAADDANELIEFYGDGAALVPPQEFNLPIGSSHQARFEAAGTNFDTEDDGQVIWSTVKRVKMIEIAEVP